MSSYLNSETMAIFTGAFSRHFQTFSRDGNRVVTIHKEPLKTIVNNQINTNIYGYGPAASPPSFGYTPVSQSFAAIIMYNLEQKQSELEEVKYIINKGEVKIKVEPSCRNYIEDGRKTERIDFDDKSYNMITSDGTQNFLGLIYYVYKLENTN